MEQQKICENCKFYKEIFCVYFSRLRRCGGFCANDSVHKPYSKSKFNPKPCEKWELNSGCREAQKKKFKEVIEEMHQRLDDIAQILSVDEI